MRRAKARWPTSAVFTAISASRAKRQKSEHRLRAIEKGKPLFRLQNEGSDSRSPQSLAATQLASLIDRLTFTYGDNW